VLWRCAILEGQHSHLVLDSVLNCVMDSRPMPRLFSWYGVKKCYLIFSTQRCIVGYSRGQAHIIGRGIL